MILFKTIADLTVYLDNKRNTPASIGFVPTMGALHAGHLSLVEHSKKNTNITVCSIFINPTQFNDPNDFAKYPVTLEQDLLLLEKAGCDIVFLPSVTEMYPAGTAAKRPFRTWLS
jgi:pantoate--beta-alanine ligase